MAKHVIFITGAAGYVGAMLVDQWSSREDVAEIIALDMAEPEAFVKDRPKVTWISANTSDGTWQNTVAARSPDIVVHAAWQIRNLYGNADLQWKWNVHGSGAVFRFAFDTPSVRRLIHFSTAAVLGASPQNDIKHLFDERAPLADEVYLYAKEKKTVEQALVRMSEERSSPLKVSIIRPAAITGPRGRFMRIRFGLQSALTGKLKGAFVYDIIRAMTSFVPATEKWCRQFVHEDDLVDIVTALAFSGPKSACELYNIAPPGPVVRPKDMALVTGKRVLVLPPWMIRVAFFVMRHLTFGKVPTAAGAWRYYSFPTVMDGAKVTKELGISYTKDSLTAFRTTSGRYEYAVPEADRVAS